jgi:hypothetical protein
LCHSRFCCCGFLLKVLGDDVSTDNPKYKTVLVSDLIPYARNSRTHSDTQVTKIASSIKEFGFLNPVLVDGANGIIAGHGRVMAAQKLGLKEVPVLQIGHLSDTQKRAYIIADNRLALDAGWDEEMLRVEFAELTDDGFNLELTGFELGQIEDIDSGVFGDERKMDEDKYTAKLETPIYEIKGENPTIQELYNNDKTGNLVEKILKTNMPDDVKGFLMAAATRHTVFNYEKIAEFYAHQDKDIQDLMEQSALVIIDYDKAIENGYIKMSKELMALSGESDDAE